MDSHSGDDSGETADERFQELERLAGTDPLTGLPNRRGAEQSIAREISRAERHRTPLSCVLLDIDRFIEINFASGHLVGDQVLRELSGMMRHSVRAYDIVARWGGDEFLLVLPNANLETARQVAERIRFSVQKLPTPTPGTVTISAGAAEFDTNYDFEATLRAAHRRMCAAKRSGEGDLPDPHAPVREPRRSGPEDRSSAASVKEPEPERRVDARSKEPQTGRS
jgi:diguanylate cyclase (GGDEF)-like protein